MTTVQSTTKERPIIMSGESVRAILEGRKHQTRRVVKPIRGVTPDRIAEAPQEVAAALCPYGTPGDRLWVRETFFDHGPEPWEDDGPPSTVEDLEARIEYRATEWDRKSPTDGGWTSPIFMPRWASRITLEVIGVRVQRLQQISPAGARLEGMAPYCCDGYGGSPVPSCGCGGRTAVDRFRVAWGDLNAKHGHGWETDPWVWVLSFRRLDP